MPNASSASVLYAERRLKTANLAGFEELRDHGFFDVSVPGQGEVHQMNGIDKQDEPDPWEANLPEIV
jgi:hypothetical protein